MKRCKTCQIEKDKSNFGTNKYSKDKLNYDCNECRANYEQKRREKRGIKPKPKPQIPDNKHKECLKCRQIFHIDDFPLNSRGRLNRGTYCKTCFPVYISNLRASDLEKYKQKSREGTQKYRDANREYWRSLNRINQFNRKNKIKAASDGSVTPSFMKSLYEKEQCCWCKQTTPRELRTAEHLIPLNLGGLHSALNLDMACESCNSSKLNFPKIHDNS